MSGDSACLYSCLFGFIVWVGCCRLVFWCFGEKGGGVFITLLTWHAMASEI